MKILIEKIINWIIQKKENKIIYQIKKNIFDRIMQSHFLYVK